MAGKIPYLAYNEGGGDVCFRSLLTPHSARTNVRAVPYVILVFQYSYHRQSSKCTCSVGDVENNRVDADK
jgi:hypothetical protein